MGDKNKMNSSEKMTLFLDLFTKSKYPFLLIN